MPLVDLAVVLSSLTAKAAYLDITLLVKPVHNAPLLLVLLVLFVVVQGVLQQVVLLRKYLLALHQFAQLAFLKIIVSFLAQLAQPLEVVKFSSAQYQLHPTIFQMVLSMAVVLVVIIVQALVLAKGLLCCPVLLDIIVH